MNIAILLSGGVDSSVALHMLKRGGHDLTAFYLKIWLEDDIAAIGACPWQEDLEYARAVCEQADVPLEIMPLQGEYYERVIHGAVNELKAGRTPSPDIQCNSCIKFGAFNDALDTRFERIASGHYARIVETDDTLRLARAPDPVKDQTYFLSRLNQAQLRRAMFPIGHMTKAQVRAEATALDLPTKDRPDSQGICFLGKIPYNEFVRHHLGERPGDIVNRDTGAVLGPHRGCWFYTIGQRQGLGLSGGPWYVVEKDLENNIVAVAHTETRDTLARDAFDVHDIHWIAGPPSTDSLTLKLRHGPEMVGCTITHENDRLHVKMDSTDPGVAPGQSAVFYDGEICLGNAIIV